MIVIAKKSKRALQELTKNARSQYCFVFTHKIFMHWVGLRKSILSLYARSYGTRLQPRKHIFIGKQLPIQKQATDRKDKKGQAANGGLLVPAS